ncbi:alpha/beta fold hydrolase [Methylomonas sp. AM2-LC]|uniref:alpha/beta fold hydrolase n=1 Tax=Methylomonas sp. AM2-LC TaxID=3153301 RepID=UPI00326778E3
MQTVELAFEHFGEQHTTCPILILHGFFASSRNWRGIAKQLAIHYPVYVLDMRNHGFSPHHEKMDYPAMAADLEQFMDQQGISKAHLIGHSMGGKIAMWFAFQHPQRIEKLIVVDIAPISYKHCFDSMINALKSVPLSSLDNRKQAEEWLASRISDANYRQFLLQNLVFKDNQYSWRINLDFFQNNAQFITAFPDTSSIPPYPYPILFLAGETSGYVKENQIYALFPQAKITIINGTGHWLQVDAPEKFCLAVIEWLKT